MKCHLDKRQTKMAVAEHVAINQTFATDVCDRKNGGIPLASPCRVILKIRDKAGISADLVAVSAQMALGDTTVGLGRPDHHRGLPACWSMTRMRWRSSTIEYR